MATHIRAGEIIATQDSSSLNTFQFTLNVYRDTDSPIVDEFNTLFFGDGTDQTVRFSSVTPLGNNTEKYVYKYTHTYPAPGYYIAYHWQRNRNSTIVNIDNPDDNTFYIETTVRIDPFLGTNSSPVLLNPPVDVGGRLQKFLHNPAAYDPDGDSLSFELITPRQYLPGQDQLLPVTNYRYPDEANFTGTQEGNNQPGYFFLDSLTGDMEWNTPGQIGEFNVAFEIQEWRDGQLLGYMVRDMQIIIEPTDNIRPKLIIPPDVCIIAGQEAKGFVLAEDDFSNLVRVTATGKPYEFNPAFRRPYFKNNSGFIPPTFQDSLIWQTDCQMVRKEPYKIYIKAEDSATVDGVQLIDLKTWEVKVMGPRPQWDTLFPRPDGVQLRWESYTCSNADSIYIYRKVGPSDFQNDTCGTGLPPSTGFLRIASVPLADTSFLDTSLNLQAGNQFCYRLTALFPGQDEDTVESKASTERCLNLEAQFPILLNVSVNETAGTSGKIWLRWTRPFTLDSSFFQPPYALRILARAQGNTGPWTTLAQNIDPFNGDTTLVHSGIDTRNSAWDYALLFSYEQNGAEAVDTVSRASSVFLQQQNQNLQWAAQTPWANQGFVHYIEADTGGEWFLLDSLRVGTAPFRFFMDAGQYPSLDGLNSVRLRVQTQGSYGAGDIPSPLFNYSQAIEMPLIDTVPPCPTTLTLEAEACPSCQTYLQNPQLSIRLSWLKSLACLDKEPQLRFLLENTAGDTLYLGEDSAYWDELNAAQHQCYTVYTIDSRGNRKASNEVCKASCNILEFPNVLTPNADGINDVFQPLCFSPALFQNHTLDIYNRWGRQLAHFQNQPIPKWNPAQGKEAPTAGTYFYYFQGQRPDGSIYQQKGYIELLK